ncbi:hypothetical protein [Moheibacter sediminis]|uniref:Uncharacterized protein n=1 Tax=Moheibacter sediminis TaxID=1434700 RepID=A0A1W2BBP2_9FLAO|nr:hypothetical protein [Moheibacter sediminis]SMC70319.1 hypothetical protein SAMN06296427_10632 [Moheibacter sediminis]
MKKIVLIIVVLIVLFGIVRFLLNLLVESAPMYKEYQKFVNNFDLELKGEIIDIKSDGSLRIACLKVEHSNYKEYYKVEGNRFFMRVKDSLAVMIYSTKDVNKFRHHQYRIGSQLLINHNNNKKIIELEEKHTIDIYGIDTFPVRDYLKNSCIPN